MNPRLIKFHITPRVLLADTPQTITVEGLDESCRFFDDIEYTVTITSIYEWQFATEDSCCGENCACTHTLKCRAEKGVISINYTFKGEGEWKITVVPEKLRNEVIEHNKKYGWDFRLPAIQNETCYFTVYSLKQDLYDKKVFKGDLHVHTWGSDGWESPEYIASRYRQYGFDFMAITDHYKFEPSLQAIESFKDIPTSFKIFPGEEVHALHKSTIHMVNFNPKSSVNTLIEYDAENTERKIREIADTLDMPCSADRLEKAWYIWVYNEIKKSGGIAIFPHPVWRFPVAFNVRLSTSEMLFEEHLFDVFELVGGNNMKGNNFQAQLYYTKALEGYKYPIVASSDCHSTNEEHQSHFNDSWTFVFSEDMEKIPENILKGNTVAIENTNPKEKTVYGDTRLTNYAWFLIEHYFEIHDMLCSHAGWAMVEYTLGNKENKTLIKTLEEKVEKYRVEFFGK